MKDIYLGLKFALSYFTVLPIAFKQTDDLSRQKVLSSMLFFFPLVGLLLGAVSVCIYIFVFQSLDMIGAVISAVLYMVFYGFIHTEAIADIADALYAKHSGKDPYKVIKEPTIGAMGLLYTMAFFIVKVSIIAFLLIHSMFFELLTVAMFSRFFIVILIKLYDFKSTFVNLLKSSLSNTTVISGAFLICLIGFLLTPALFLPLFIAGILSSLLIAKLIGNKLGFLNGDVLGTSLELTEVLLLIGIALCL
jgi:adenosylcobinamide-GDP ribazoletransferase